jgi:hypothetical protein
MKTRIATSVVILSLVTACNFSVSNDQITVAVSVGTGATLQYAIKDQAKRTIIANYVQYIATVVRTVTGSPTPSQLTSLIGNAVPSNVKVNYPELLTLVSPLIVSSYQLAYDKYGADAAKIYPVLGAIALGLENGSAPYVTHG